ncbi:predicted protein [Histoplasma capsulatum var. duboisii H88]|uniref:Predicted protein n=2 Tax=Ajellomyces capsulatus TaxID=5037 RepID=F0U6H2_AJEC8|nr:predicted protein [Histoplasma capsulatum H143]EGC42300.1 predicted protein [Histoplasma capsulatum var. duboisii H88]
MHVICKTWRDDEMKAGEGFVFPRFEGPQPATGHRALFSTRAQRGMKVGHMAMTKHRVLSCRGGSLAEQLVHGVPFIHCSRLKRVYLSGVWEGNVLRLAVSARV